MYKQIMNPKGGAYLFPFRRVQNSDASPILLLVAIEGLSWAASSDVHGGPERLLVFRCPIVKGEILRRPCPFCCCHENWLLHSPHHQLPFSHELLSLPTDSRDIPLSFLWYRLKRQPCPSFLLPSCRHPFRVCPDRTDWGKQKIIKILNFEFVKNNNYIEHGFHWYRRCFLPWGDNWASQSDGRSGRCFLLDGGNDRLLGRWWEFRSIFSRSLSLAWFSRRFRSSFQCVHKQRTVLQQRCCDCKE